jgi:hypothetical protein
VTAEPLVNISVVVSVCGIVVISVTRLVDVAVTVPAVLVTVSVSTEAEVTVLVSVTVETSCMVTVLGVVVVSVSVVVVITVWARLGGKNVANATKQHVTSNTPNSIL